MAVTKPAHDVRVMGWRDDESGIFNASFKVERTKHVFNATLVCAKDHFADVSVEWPISTLGRQPGPPATERIELKYGYDCKPLGIPDNASILFSKEAKLIGAVLKEMRGNTTIKEEIDKAEKQALSAGAGVHGPIRSQKPLG